MSTLADYPAKLTKGYYRVRRDWEDSDSQVGAYRILANAIAKCDANPGTYVFTSDGVKIYPEEESGEEEVVVETATEEVEDTDAEAVSEEAPDTESEEAEEEITDTEDEETEEEFPAAEELIPTFCGKLKALMNIRDTPSSEGEIITTYAKGTIVSILEVLDNGWLKIICAEAEEGTAYVSNEGDSYVNVGSSVYTVESGDTLWKIATEQLGKGTRYKELRSINNLSSNSIKVGMELILP